jgi:hypothetical protein
MSPEAYTYNGDFLENVSSDFDNNSIMFGDRVRKETCIGGILRKMTLRALGAQTRNVHFLEMALPVARIALLFGIQQSPISYRNVDGVRSIAEHVRCIFLRALAIVGVKFSRLLITS